MYSPLEYINKLAVLRLNDVFYCAQALNELVGEDLLLGVHLFNCILTFIPMALVR